MALHPFLFITLAVLFFTDPYLYLYLYLYLHLRLYLHLSKARFL